MQDEIRLDKVREARQKIADGSIDQGGKALEISLDRLLEEHFGIKPTDRIIQMKIAA
ncbi:hypothetical protein KW783_00815 [Candidatus Parcubacteria bacterium]|nr:hypothetical protein [Candidatus Parcubacteria bacterium]